MEHQEVASPALHKHFIGKPQPLQSRKGSNSESMRQGNRATVFRLILEAGVITRIRLSELSGLQQATMTIIMNEFLEAGLVREVGLVEGKNGRRLKGFSVSDDCFATIAIRFSNKYVAIGIYDIHAKCITVRKIYTNTYKDINSTLHLVEDEIERQRKVVGARKYLGAGLSVDGPFFLSNGIYYLNLNGEAGTLDIGERLSTRLGMSVLVNRTSNFGGYCLWKSKTYQHNTGTLINIMISHLIECSIIVNGQILTGVLGMAGLFGRLLPTGVPLDDNHPAIMDDVIAPESILAKVVERMAQYPDSMLKSHGSDMLISDVIDAYMREDPLALAVYDEAGVQLGIQIANLVNIINPDTVVVGDEIPYSERMYHIVRGQIDKYVLPDAGKNLQLILAKTERKTENDIALIGSSQYVRDIALSQIGSKELGED